MKKQILISLLLAATLSGCEYFHHKYQSGTVAEVAGQYLYESDLQQVLAGLSSEDSARVREQYIRQWASDILFYETAKDRADQRLDDLVEAYRRSLYIHTYEERLIQQRMPKHVADTLVEAFYQSHADRFILKESIVKGALLVVPIGAPDLNKLKKKLQSIDETSIEDIEKYAYKYATGYELFLDEWRTANQLLLRMPFEKNTLDQELKKSSQIVMQDSINTYILQVTDKHLQGSNMPMDYARAEIEKILLQQRQSEFLRQEREKQYQDAVRFKKIIFYEQ